MFKKRYCKIFVFVFLLSVVTISCKNPSEIETFYSPDLRTPVVTGIRITNEMAEEIAVWGYLSDPESPVGEVEQYKNLPDDDGIHVFVPMCGLDMRTPYPNPTNGECVIRYDIGKTSHVKIWVVPAVLSGEDESNIVNLENTLLVKPGIAIAVLVDRQSPPGAYQVHWSGGDSQGNEVPGGFYRIYIQADEYLLWRDVAVWREPGDLPPDLETYIYYH